ncbi:ATP-binding protein [Mycobacterium sp. TNTM28]|uniref:ATP-binding protein n=1 Tax=[Mycobacterium] fortunisiensis TaxID=2600579 RepID=A0ABS6KMM4_9MYCO|nr:ATP-binding protein [[Mycobacterium] fortunisiensis]MBU9764526.1 ATP-binding protein [[Mycobacterium] fortunisiensis]
MRTPLGKPIPRHAQSLVSAALGDTRVVLVNGARQCGKSTLVRLAARNRDAEWRDLDSATSRQSALADPDGFVDVEQLMVIDEIQRVPDLLLAIKAQVDQDPRPGRYLLTGSARVLGLRSLPDTLVGRMETIELWPFSQGEISDMPDRFIDAAFSLGDSMRHASTVTRADYAQRVVRGGFPEAVARSDERRRRNFFSSYVGDLIARDIQQLTEIERTPEMHALVRMLAGRSGQLLSITNLGNELGIGASTVKRYFALLEEVFLIKRIPAWSRNISSRATSTPKVAFVDSGIAAHQIGADARNLLRPTGQFGPLLENFAVMELARQRSWSDEDVELFHYRTRDQVEVDAVLENRRGEVVGIGVKAASTVGSNDFRGLHHLAERTGDDFRVGIVLYTGQQTLPFGPKMLAVPVSALWELG